MAAVGNCWARVSTFGCQANSCRFSSVLEVILVCIGISGLWPCRYGWLLASLWFWLWQGLADVWVLEQLIYDWAFPCIRCTCRWIHFSLRSLMIWSWRGSLILHFPRLYWPSLSRWLLLPWRRDLLRSHLDLHPVNKETVLRHIHLKSNAIKN